MGNSGSDGSAAWKTPALDTPALEADGAQSPVASGWLGEQPKHRIFIVANPTAGGGEVGENWSEFSEMLESVLGPYSYKLTERRRHATELASKALDDGFDVVLSLGGDGTLNETINGFFRDGAPINPNAAVGILPCGTGGDFKRTLGLSGDMREAAEWIRNGHKAPLDVGELTFVAHDGKDDHRYFANIASCGISGLVDKKVNESSKALGGKLTYVMGTIRAWSEYDPPSLNVVIDNGINAQIRTVLLAVANGRYFGGGMTVAPFANIDDGMFDIVIVRKMNIRQLLPNAYRLYDGRMFESPAVSHMQAREIYVEPTEPGTEVLLDIDGEAPGRLPATFRILPGCIRILRG